MTPPNFIISPCIPSDVDQMVNIYERAFQNDYLSSFTFPKNAIPTSVKRRWLHDRFLTSLSKPEIRNFKVVDTETGNIAAWSRWGFPYALNEEEKADKHREKEREKLEGKRSEWPEGANLEVCDLKFGALDRIRNRNVDWENTYVVYLLQTDPAYQRKGLASMLLKYGLAMADSEGRKAYIEATAEGHPVYLKLGFRDIDVLRLDLSKWGGTTPGVNTIMMRDPQPV